jgi:hypothetical protein
MYQGIKRLGGVVALGTALLTIGCTEMYLAFGPGGIWGPQQGGVGGTTTTQPTVIAAPRYIASQIDPVLEMTAGAKVAVVAQLNDDNGDGVIDNNDLPDLVSGSEESQPIQIHLNNGNGTFSTYTIAGGGPIARMVDIQIADFDSDGRNDIAVLVNDTGFTPVQGAQLRGAVVLLFCPPDPTDTLAWQEVNLTQPFNLPGDGTGMTSFAVGDINGDGSPDIVLASNEIHPNLNGVDHFIRLFINPGPAFARVANDRAVGLCPTPCGWHEAYNPNPLVAPKTIGPPLEADAVVVKSLALTDIDGDGDLDIVASFPSARTFNIRWLQNPLIDPPPGLSFGENAWKRSIVGQQGEVDPSNPGGDFIAVGDIDGDGAPDVASAHAALGLVQWFRNPARPAEAGGNQIVRQTTYPWPVFNLLTLRSGNTINQLQLTHIDAGGPLQGFLTASGTMIGFTRGANVDSMWQAFVITTTNPVATIGRCAIADVTNDGLIDIVAPLDRDGLINDQIILLRRVSP